MEEAIAQDGAMIFFHEGAGSQWQVRRWLAKELGSMKNIIELFLSAIKAESDTGVAAAPKRTVITRNVRRRSTVSRQNDTLVIVRLHM